MPLWLGSRAREQRLKDVGNHTDSRACFSLNRHFSGWSAQTSRGNALGKVAVAPSRKHGTGMQTKLSDCRLTGGD